MVEVLLIEVVTVTHILQPDLFFLEFGEAFLLLEALTELVSPVALCLLFTLYG